MEDKESMKDFLNSILVIVFALVLGSIAILLVQGNPIEVYGVLVTQTLLTGEGMLNTLHYAAPLILTGLAISITFKANVFNMGFEGQFLLGGFVAGLVGAYFTGMNHFVHKAACLILAMLSGILLALFPALLKVKWRANEISNYLNAQL